MRRETIEFTWKRRAGGVSEQPLRMRTEVLHAQLCVGLADGLVRDCWS